MVANELPDDAALRRVLGDPRFDKYTDATSGDTDGAIRLYGWNAELSAAFILPAHFAEVAVRNAVAEAIELAYGTDRWPWDGSFQLSLPTTDGGRNPRKWLRDARSAQPTAGKVIAELPFVFWERMLTARHDGRLWKPHLATVFPQAGTSDVADLRGTVFADLQVIRGLRNRIAHHEPIFARDHLGELERMMRLVRLRSDQVAAWVSAMERVTELVAEGP